MTRRLPTLIGLAAFMTVPGLIRDHRAIRADDGNHGARFEVWAIDQSNSPGKTFGGTLYIYRGHDLVRRPARAEPEVIDLGGAVSDVCRAQTGADPVRPHIVSFNAAESHAIIAFVASGHVAFLDAATRMPIRCFRMSAGAGGARQAHAAFAAPDDSYVIVANQNGKRLERINTEYASNVFVHDTAATLDLATCTTPNGIPCEAPGLRPDNAPICPVIDATSTLTFVTLRGGGMLVVDSSAAGAPPPIVAEYTMTALHPTGCGGMQKGVSTAGKIYFNAGGGGATNPLEEDLYSLPAATSDYTAANPPNVPMPVQEIPHNDAGDSHGMLLNVKRHGRYLWAGDRFLNHVRVVDTTRTPPFSLVNTFSLVSRHSADPAPDLMDIEPGGRHAFMSLRGPCPLTANAPGVNNAVGVSPGVMVVQVTGGGFNGRVLGIAPIRNPGGAPCAATGSTEQADPHGIAVRALRESDGHDDDDGGEDDDGDDDDRDDDR
jgi:hypothetical protein